MKIGFIGAGRVGFSLGKLFSSGPVQVIGYYSRHKESALAAAQFTNSNCYEDPGGLIVDCDVVFITVPDSVIPEVFDSLKSFDLKEKQFCHCSGSMTSREAFPGIADTGALACSIHPLFPVSDRYKSYRELKGAFFCLEGDESCLTQWEHLLKEMGLKVQLMSNDHKVRYHAACAIASNLVCALVQESLDLLEGCGFSRQEGLDALAPLLKSNMDHILDTGPVRALTGPVERNDVDTVKKHLSSMPGKKDRDLYRAVSVKLIDLAQEKDPSADYTAMKVVLKEDSDYE